MTFMHLGEEKTNMKWAIIAPMFILIPYLLFIIIVEGFYNHTIM
jgi:cytochrome c oxidase subunit 4